MKKQFDRIFFEGFIYSKMPWVYTHNDVTQSTTRKFECELQCIQCEATSNRGERCARKVCMWLPFCWQHTQIHFGVRVRPSVVLPGDSGLFATRSFRKHEMIVPYGGELLTEAQISNRYRKGPMALGSYLLGRIDSACTRYVASASNGAFGSISPSSANVKFESTGARYQQHSRPAGTVVGNLALTRDNMGIKFWTIATRDIEEGEELVAWYGNQAYSDALLQREAECGRRGVNCNRTRQRRRSPIRN